MLDTRVCPVLAQGLSESGNLPLRTEYDKTPSFSGDFLPRLASLAKALHFQKVLGIGQAVAAVAPMSKRRPGTGSEGHFYFS